MPSRGSAIQHRAKPVKPEKPASRKRTTPRKRPQQQRSRATVDQILAATARVLVKEGFDKTSTNRVAEVAGVSIGSLYQYFPSKEALVAALAERHIEGMTELILGAMARIIDQPLRVAVREMVGIMLHAHAVDPALHRVLIEQVPRIGRLDRVHDVERQAAALARAYLEKHREELRPTNLDLAAFLVVQAVESITHAVVLHEPERLQEQALVEELTALVLRYLT